MTDSNQAFTVICNKCKHEFALNYDGEGISTIEVRWCLSGGVYELSIKCPACKNEKDVQWGDT